MTRQKFATARLASAILTITVLTLALAVVPAAAQNPVPPTAREAATLPEFASRLARHVPPEAAGKKRAQAPACSRRVSQQDKVIYENGPANGTTDAWTINFGYVVSDTFTVSGNLTVSGFDLYAWEFPGDVMTAVDWSITSAPNGGTVYGSGTASVTDQFISTNQLGYNIDKVSGSGLNVSTGGGTFYLNLQNAVVPSGDPIYWDENSGIGCKSQGCPSQAAESAVGTIPSEAFDMVGSSGPGCFQSNGTLEILHDFTGKEDGSSPFGVTSDKAGNLYGALPSGGGYGNGLVYKLTWKNGDWMFSDLYSFQGGPDGASWYQVIIGPDGALYGPTHGGIQNCGKDGSGYCGRVVRWRPSPFACLTGPCGWTEDVLYRKTGNGDPMPDSNLVFDQAGNLYGTCAIGNYGAVCELTPSNGGWTDQLIYSFTGGNDASPSSLVVGNDGNLYGTTEYNGAGEVYQLTPSPGGWIETVLYTFQPYSLIYGGHFVWDSSGNLYGASFDHSSGYGESVIFTVSPSNGKWTYTVIWQPSGNYDDDDVVSLTIDAWGDLFGIREADTGCRGDGCDGSASPSSSFYTWIFELFQENGQWYYNPLYEIDNQYFHAVVSGRDPLGLHGTTYDCGAWNQGTVWELYP